MMKYGVWFSAAALLVSGCDAGSQLNPSDPVGKYGAWVYASGACLGVGGNKGSYDEKWGISSMSECQDLCDQQPNFCVAAEFSIIGSGQSQLKANGKGKATYNRCELHNTLVTGTAASVPGTTCAIKDTANARASWQEPINKLEGAGATVVVDPAATGLPRLTKADALVKAEEGLKVAQDGRAKAQAEVAAAVAKEAAAKLILEEWDAKKGTAATPEALAKAEQELLVAGAQMQAVLAEIEAAEANFAQAESAVGIAESTLAAASQAMG